MLQLLKRVSLESMLHNKRSHHNEKAAHHKYNSKDLAQPKNKQKKLKQKELKHFALIKGLV